jgi:hypothetical protein
MTARIGENLPGCSVPQGGVHVIAVQLKREITSLLDALPEPKLAVIFDFVQFLAERDLQAAWISAQSQSAAYQEWIGSDNDIYDEVFADVYPAR